MYPYKRLIGLIERKGYKMKITQITVVVAHVVIMLLFDFQRCFGTQHSNCEDSVYFTANGITRTEFSTTDTVTIWFGATPIGGTVNLQIYYEDEQPDNTIDMQLLQTSDPVATGQGTFKPGVPRYYYIEFIGTGTPRAGHMLHIIGGIKVFLL